VLFVSLYRLYALIPCGAKANNLLLPSANFGAKAYVDVFGTRKICDLIHPLSVSVPVPEPVAVRRLIRAPTLSDVPVPEPVAVRIDTSSQLAVPVPSP
jgi:hypothetical protein